MKEFYDYICNTPLNKTFRWGELNNTRTNEENWYGTNTFNEATDLFKNGWQFGADEMYTGKMVLDQATLDRFAIIEFDYCLKIEMAITHNNAELVEFIHQMRKEAESKGIRATFSYRCMTMITKLEAKGMNLEMAMKISIVKGLDKDTINTFNPNGSTKYHNALRKIQLAA